MPDSDAHFPEVYETVDGKYMAWPVAKLDENPSPDLAQLLGIRRLPIGE